MKNVTAQGGFMNPLSLWRRSANHPLPTLSTLQSDFVRLFQDLTEIEPRFSLGEFLPLCEMSEDKSAYIARFDLPGVKKEDVKIEIDGNHLTVSAERRAETKSEDKRNRISEISYGTYHRSFTLASYVDENRVDARFQDGVLTLTLPKAQSTKAKQIVVQ